ncbi:MAG TPA: response regulator [Steroidobacteraceae bacterium]|nr:response regulator [Steroidobacteraceae bacterium]
MRTVLVVDDEFGTVEVLVAALEDAGYRVLTAANGRRALESLEKSKPDLVISDFMMPLMDGAALVTAMRANSAFRDIPVIMMSSAPEAALRKRVDGYAAFLRKPFGMPVLLEIVGTVFERAPGSPGPTPPRSSSPR